jgi:hypothetical protein
MYDFCNQATEATWNRLAVDQQYQTPDTRSGVDFRIIELVNDHIGIAPQNIVIQRAALFAAVHHLYATNHYAHNPCRVQSNNDPLLSGPLCRVSRDANNNVRCINYILPLLSAGGVVDINGNRPNTTWLR